MSTRLFHLRNAVCLFPLSYLLRADILQPVPPFLFFLSAESCTLQQRIIRSWPWSRIVSLKSPSSYEFFHLPNLTIIVDNPTRLHTAYVASCRVMPITSRLLQAQNSPVVRGRLTPFPIAAEMPGSACKQKILCEFFRKRAIELQAAVTNYSVSIPMSPVGRRGNSVPGLAWQ